MPRSLTSLCASVCSLILIACSSGNIDTAEPSEESDIPVEIETSTEDSSVSPSESAENDGGDIDPSTKSDDGLANASETIEINRAFNINTSSSESVQKMIGNVLRSRAENRPLLSNQGCQISSIAPKG